MKNTEVEKPKKRKRRGSQLVFRRKRANGTFYDGWWIRTTDGFGDRHLEWGGDTKDAAQQLLRKRQSERYEGRRTGERPVGHVAFKDIENDVLEHWRATLTPSTVAGRKGLLKQTSAYFGDRAMKTITTADVNRLLVKFRLKDNKKAATVRHYAAVLSSAWEYAIANRAAATNVCRGLDLPRADRRAVPYITDEQRRGFYARVPQRFRVAAMLLGDAGLRRGEVLDLTWNHVGPEFSNVTVARSKNHKPRVVQTTPRLQAALRELFDARDATPIEGPATLFDFPSHEFNEVVRKAANAAGLRGFTPHMFRHAFASWLAQTGTPLTEIARILGHADIQMAARYAQWSPADAGVRAIAALGADSLHSKSPESPRVARGS
jgi:integrase